MRVMRVMRVLAAIAMVTLLAACGSSSGSSGSNALGGSGAKNAAAVVELKNNAFNPPTVTIRSGQTVLWEFNDGGIVHNVTGDGYRSKDMGSGTYSHKFTSSGTYHYQCTIHSGMTGQVIVNP